jgi:FkbM family methyltransferase
VRRSAKNLVRRIGVGARQFAWARREQWRARKLAGRRLLRVFADAYPDAFFVEIGANDGYQGDHLRPLVLSKPWRGIMVEPQPDAFRRLARNYGGLSRIALENAAIADRDGRLPFYEIAPPADPDAWELVGPYDQLGSLSRDALLSHGWIADLEQRIVRTEVDCLRFESLCEKHDVRRIDLLLIDTEGHDYEVLKQLDLSVHRPRLIAFEHALLTPADRQASTELLEGRGYELMEENFDTWCLDTTVEDRVTERWRGLRPVGPGVTLRSPS